jgi:3-dehydroquinate dehydratase/shikimate dehydrogenase
VQSGNLIELRLDCLEDLEYSVDFPVPVILTFRPSEQGGRRDLSREARLAFWNTQAARGDSVWWDLEADLLSEVSPDWSRTIVSHHDFSGVSTDLDKIYERLSQTPARVLKIAVQANEIVDCIPVFRLLERARKESREVIAIAMGNAGIATRVLGPSRGSFLTYATPADGNATAPGQISALSLRSLYRIDEIDEETIICGVIGLPVVHSFSPRIHNAAFQSEGVNGVYLPFEVRNVRDFFKRMVHPRTRELNWKLRGLSVTAPHKQSVIELLDWIDPEAEKIGAVNTVVVENDGLLGYNTDVAGLIEPLIRRLGSLEDKRVAIIGAGGAARAGIRAMQQHGARVAIFARNANKAHSLAQSFAVSCESLATASFAGFDVVINATPLGSVEHIDESPATEKQLTGAGCVYDLVYNPAETRLLREAKNAGCETLGGLEMLVAQAKIQFELWSHRSPRILVDSDSVLKMFSDRVNR